MNDIFNIYTKYIVVYIDDVLIFSTSVEQHFKHIKIFLNIIIKNGLVLSKSKIELFQIKTRSFDCDISNGTIKSVQRAIEFAEIFGYNS